MVKIADLIRLDKSLGVIMGMKFNKPSSAYKLDSIINLLKPHYVSIMKVKQELLDKYFENNNGGNVDFSTLSYEKREEFSKEYNDFLMTDVTDDNLESSIKRFTIEEFSEATLPEGVEKNVFDLEFIQSIKILIKE